MKALDHFESKEPACRSSSDQAGSPDIMKLKEPADTELST